MSILARLAQLQGITIDGLEPPRTTQTQDRTQVRNIVSSPTIEGMTVEEAREASRGAAEAAGETGIPSTPPTVSQPPAEQPPEEPPVDETGGAARTIVSTQTVIKNGRNILQTIYSDGTIEEQDLGPVDQGPPEPPPVFFPALKSCPPPPPSTQNLPGVPPDTLVAVGPGAPTVDAGSWNVAGI